jgi:hypothetical protein
MAPLMRLPNNGDFPMRYFHEIRVGQLFHLNGNDWRKRSSRTAELVDGRPGAGPLGKTWAYFGATEVVSLVSGEEA